MTRPRKEQFSGCIIGQALGDAAGFVVEGYSTSVCKQYVKNVLTSEKPMQQGRSPFSFGQYSDDTQLARELLQSIVIRLDFDPVDYAQRIADIFSSDRIVGRGRATQQAADRLNRGVPWDQAGAPSSLAGNGSAMRSAPVGLLFFDNPERMLQVATDQGRITHQDPRAVAGSIAIAGAVAIALETPDIKPADFCGQITEWTAEISPLFSEQITRLPEWVELPWEKAMPLIAAAGLDPAEGKIWEGISPYVVSSVLWSLYAFLKTPHNYWDTICTAIICGGDVDTTAAMAGAVSGAYLGLESIPKEIARHLNDQGAWTYSDLVNLAERSFDMKLGA